jgi:cytochrome P450
MVDLTSDEQLKCHALDHVIKEAMRLHPVAAIGAFRETKREFQMNETTFMPKGAVVIIAVLLFHRNPQYFDQPDQFLPDRWNTTIASAQQDVTDGSVAYMPFVTGSCNCAGQALATAEMQTVIARIFREYDLEVIDPGIPDWTLSLKPKGVLLKARKI